MLLFLTEQSRTIKNDAWKELPVPDFTVFSMQWYKVVYWTCFFGGWMQHVLQKDQPFNIRSVTFLTIWEIFSMHFCSFECIYFLYCIIYHLAIFYLLECKSCIGKFIFPFIQTQNKDTQTLKGTADGFWAIEPNPVSVINLYKHIAVSAQEWIWIRGFTHLHLFNKTLLVAFTVPLPN